MTNQEAQQLAQGIYDTIFGSLTGSPDSSKPAFDANKTFLTLQKPGVLLNANDFSNSWTPGNSTGNQQNALNLWDLVNHIPQFSAQQEDSGRKVDELYQQVLRATVTIVDHPDTEVVKQFNDANDLLYVSAKDENGNPTTVQSTLFLNYQNNEAAYVTAQTAYQQAYLAAQASPTLKAQWPILAPSLHLPAVQAYQAWRSAGADKVEGALAILQTSGGNQVQRAFADAQLLYAGYTANLDAGGAGAQRSAIAPSNWYTSASQAHWAKVEWSHSTSVYNSHSDFTSYGGGGGFSLGLWSVGGSASHQSQSFHSDATLNAVKISYSFALLTIRRPWMSELLLSLPGWKTDAAAKGHFSSGKKAGQDSTIFSLIPQAFVVVKDLVITADFSQSEINTASSSSSGGASVGWGPFSISGSYSHSDSSVHVSGDIAHGRLAQSGMQIIGWVNEIVPFSPPE